MALEFYVIDIGVELTNLDDLCAALELLAALPKPVEAFNEEYNKLSPWVFACRRAGFEVGHFYDDTYLCSHQVDPILEILRACYCEIAT